MLAYFPVKDAPRWVYLEACTAKAFCVCCSFMQCDRCDKWRVAPYEITQPSWVCEQNTWDRRYASCSVPEQPDPAAQMQQQQTRQQQQLLQQQQLQQQQLLQQQRFAGSSAPRPKAKAKAKSRAPSKGTAAVQRPLQTGNSAADAVSHLGSSTAVFVAARSVKSRRHSSVAVGEQQSI